jgi:YqzH-like protein
MDRSLIRKMMIQALKDYFWEEEDCILTEKEWAELEAKVLVQMDEDDQKEAVYAIIQDVVYDYFTAK